MMIVCLFWKVDGKAKTTEESLPELQTHPLPSSLAKWGETSQTGDYFAQIQPTPVGYLIWSDFPVKVYFTHPPVADDNSATTRRNQEWLVLARQAIAEWDKYLPIKEVPQPELADIIIKREHPPLGVTFNSETGKLNIPRARTAQTTYNFYVQQSVLRHQMVIRISPNVVGVSLLSALRHELGHGLGIWGHSPVETDALYFSQVAQVPPISVRDINTLKKIYQQPTRLGWQISANP